MKRDEAAASQPQNGRCPSCGACKECGAGAHPHVVPTPYPVWPNPYARPYAPHWQPYWQQRPWMTGGSSPNQSGGVCQQTTIYSNSTKGGMQ